MSNELDKQFSDRLIGYESAVDAEALWQAVKPPRRKKPWTWLWLLVVSGILLIGAVWWYLDEQPENAAIASTGASVEKAMTATAEEEVSAARYPSSEKWTNTSTASDSPENKRSNDQAIVPTSLTATKTIASSSSPGIVKNKPSSSTGITNPSFTPAVAEINATQEIEINVKENENEREEANTTNNILAELTTSTENDNTVRESNASLPIETAVAFSRSQAESTALISILEMEPLPTQLNTALPALSSTNILPVAVKPSSWFFQMEAGYYSLHRTLSNNDSLGGEWVSKREQTESLLEANALDMAIGYPLNNKWEIRSGLAYTQINTVFNYTNSTIEVDTVEGLQVIVYEGNTVVDSIFGPIASYTSTFEEKRTYNSFRQWEVPLIVAYNFGAGKLHYQAEAGLRLLVQRRWEGDIIDANDEFVDLAEKDWYRNELGLSFQLGLKAVYELTPRTSVLAGFNTRYYPQQFTTDNAPFREHYQLLGASISLRHDF